MSPACPPTVCGATMTWARSDPVVTRSCSSGSPPSGPSGARACDSSAVADRPSTLRTRGRKERQLAAQITSVCGEVSRLTLVVPGEAPFQGLRAGGGAFDGGIERRHALDDSHELATKLRSIAFGL